MPDGTTTSGSTRTGARRKALWFAAGLVVIGVTVTALAMRDRPPAALRGIDSTWTNIVEVEVDEVVFLGLKGLGASGEDPISFRSAELMGVPDGLAVEGPYFVRNIGGGILGATEAIRPRLQPVGSVVFESPEDEDDWSLVVGLRGSRPGSYRTAGFRVCYSVAGQDDCRTFSNIVVGLDVKIPSEQAGSA